MYIFDLREEKRQTIRCTPHIKDFKSSVPSRRSPLRSILGFHCDLVVVLHCDIRSPLRSSVSIAILSSSSIAIFGLYCDLRFRYTTNSFPTEASLNKQRAIGKGRLPTRTKVINVEVGICVGLSAQTHPLRIIFWSPPRGARFQKFRRVALTDCRP